MKVANDLEHICNQVIDIVNEVGNFITGEMGQVQSQDIETKSMNSLVSYVDKTSEGMLVAELSRVITGSVFLAEENTVSPESGKFQWVIDPLDGTTNFLHRLPCFAISVALRENLNTVLGVVLEVNRKECFYAWKGSGAFLNKQPIQVSNTSTLDHALLATGFPYHDFSRNSSYLEVLEYFMRNTRGIRRFGAAAVDLAYVACGRFDGFFEYGLSPWDIAAGAFLVEEAGGKICDFENGPTWSSGSEIIASNPSVFPEFYKVIHKSFIIKDI